MERILYSLTTFNFQLLFSNDWIYLETLLSFMTVPSKKMTGPMTNQNFSRVPFIFRFQDVQDVPRCRPVCAFRRFEQPFLAELMPISQLISYTSLAD